MMMHYILLYILSILDYNNNVHPIFANFSLLYHMFGWPETLQQKKSS